MSGRLLVAAACGLLMALLAGCGGSGGPAIGARDHSVLSDHLSSVKAALASSSCATIARRVSRVRQDVDALRSSVPTALEANLEQGVVKLTQAVTKQCEDAATTVPTPTVPPETTTAPEATVTETTPTVTEATPTDTATTPTPTTPAATTPAGTGGVGAGDGTATGAGG